MYTPSYDYLIHYGVGHLDGGHSGRYPWGSGENGSSDRRAMKKDIKWVKKNEKKIKKKAYSQSKKELDEYVALLAQKYGLTSRGKISRSFINAYNQGMAELMNEKIKNLEAPSGRVVQFVAKRGEIGVYTALADQGYDMNQVKKGVWGSGRIAYRQTSVEKAN